MSSRVPVAALFAARGPKDQAKDNYQYTMWRMHDGSET